jgi:hypothetical protein
MLYSPKVLSSRSFLDFKRSLEVRQVGLESAYTTHVWKEITALVTSPIDMTFTFPRIDIYREGTETMVESFIDSLVIERLAQLIADD